MVNITNFMVDLETMGVSEKAAIMSIGAVEFSSEGVGREFYCAVDLKSAVEHGGVIDASTVKWWLQQSRDAIDALGQNEDIDKPISITLALELFSQFLNENGDNSKKLWAMPGSFDLPVLSYAYINCGLKRPWARGTQFCAKTVFSFAPQLKMQRSGTHHNALDDAITQAQHLIKVCEHLGLKL